MTIEQAIRYFKTQSALAKALSIRPQSVGEWVRKGKIPEKQQLRLEKITAGTLVASDFHADDTLYMKPITIMLSDEHMELADRLGTGNRSKGVRAALRIAADQMAKAQLCQAGSTVSEEKTTEVF